MTAGNREDDRGDEGAGRSHDANGAPSAKRRRTRRAGGDSAVAEGAERALDHLRELYEVSKLLTRFESLERTVPAVMSRMDRSIGLRSALLILETRAGPKTFVWQPEGEPDDALRAAKDHLRIVYGYLGGSSGARPGDADAPFDILGDRRRPLGTQQRFILLPLVIARGPIFGALQLEGSARMDEADLTFANAVTNQLAVAIDRQFAIDARQLVADSGRARAEDAEKRARIQLEFGRAVTASVGEGVLAVDIDARITLFNPAAERMLGFSEEEALGTRVDEVLRIRQANGAPLSTDQAPLLRAMRGETVQSDDHLFEDRTGTPFAVSYTFSALTQAGQIAGAVLVFRNIIDIKRIENEQRMFASVSAALASSLNSREIIAAVVRFAVPTLADICIAHEFSDTGALQSTEAAFASEHQQRELGDRARQFPLPFALQHAYAGYSRPQGSLLVSDIAQSREAGFDHAPYELIRLAHANSMMIVPLIARENILGALTFITSESSRRYSTADLALVEEIGHRAALAIDNARLYEEARRATRVRDDLLAIVSHDLKNPVHGILLATESWSHSASGRDAPSHEWISRIRRLADRMMRLITDLLDTASIEAGRLAIEPRRVATASLVAETIETLRPLLEESSLAFENELPADLPAVNADPARLQQVLTNLFSNAIKFTPAGGTIRIGADTRGQSVCVWIRDTGAGISEEELPYVFDRFWQSQRTARLGTGLGLFIVKGIIEAHGGKIWVESRPGAGATFFFTLPVSERPAGAAQLA